MSERDKNRQDAPYDLMQDTQYLLQGLDEMKGESYALEDILAEFGTEESAPRTSGTQTAAPPRRKETERRKEKKPETAGAEKPPSGGKLPERKEHPKIINFPGTAVQVPEEENGDETMVLIDMREYEEEPESLFAAPEPEQPREEPRKEPETPTEPKELTMEDIVAGTVDAVKAEQEQEAQASHTRAERRRRKAEKKQREKREKQEKRMEIPQEREEPSAREAAAFHKRRYRESRRGLLLSFPVLVLLWMPWVLERWGITLPYFSESIENSALCVLVGQVLLSICAMSVYRAAWEELRERICTGYTYAAVTNLVALLDAATLALLPERSPLTPLGGVAGTAMVFSLWGLKGFHRGMWETLRTAAMGEPSCVVDRCEAGIAKGRGRGAGFVLRAEMESTASQWQRLMLPALLSVSVVFALLASAGQDREQDFLWCWSAILCASCSLVCPMAYCVPLERVARRLSRSGCALAGQFGAQVLGSMPHVVVTDSDLFPRGSVAISGIKLYGEERNRAISYTATLATQGGGCMARIFEEVCQEERITYQPLEHFHVHDDNGMSGMIRGETVLVGTPVFMRHMAVRLPSTLPSRTALCLAVDGELTAVFGIKYTAAPQVESALRALARNRLQLLVATRDGNVTAKFIKKCFGTDGRATLPEISDRLSLSDPQREGGEPNGMIYRDGLAQLVELAALSRRLCQIVKVGNFLSVLGNVFGAMLGFYLTFVGRSDALSPVMLMVYLLLWTLPMLPLLMGVDKM